MPKMKIWDASLATPAWIELDAKNADTLGGKAPSEYSLTSHTHTAAQVGAVGNGGNVSVFLANTELNRPAAGEIGRYFIATDTRRIYRDTGTAWEAVTASDWADITNKPATFPPDPHTHPISDVTNLQTSLDAKANLSGATFTGSVAAPDVTFGTTGKLNADQGGSIELGDSLSAGVAPFIDFHYGVGTAQDYNARIQNKADGVVDIQFLSGAKRLEVDSKSVPTRKANGSNLLVGTVETVIAEFTPTAVGNYEAKGYLRIITAATVVTFKVVWTDPSGAQNHMFVDNTSVGIGSYTFGGIFLNSAANYPIRISAIAGTANQVYASGVIEGV